MPSDAFSRNTGRYKGLGPKQAARKAYKRIIRDSGHGGSDCELSYEFTIREKKSGKESRYTGHYHLLPENEQKKIVPRGGDPYIVKHHIDVTPYNS